VFTLNHRVGERLDALRRRDGHAGSARVDFWRGYFLFVFLRYTRVDALKCHSSGQMTSLSLSLRLALGDPGFNLDAKIIVGDELVDGEGLAGEWIRLVTEQVTRDDASVAGMSAG
jgi:hypothetical protein